MNTRKTESAFRIEVMPRAGGRLAHKSAPVAHKSAPVAHKSAPVAHKSAPVAHKSAPSC